MTPHHIPGSTYRVQLNSGFRFVDARELVPYFHQLGITDLYVSPFFQAQRGSNHGYDVTDHTRLNPEIGTQADLQNLTEELRHYGIGLVLDVVPNHMKIFDESNRWWQDVLENGPSSPYAKFFDIDWAPPKEDLANKVLLPILGDQYGKVLENEEVRLCYDGWAFFIAYYDRHFPVDPRTWAAILNPICEKVGSELEADHPQLIELESIITSLEHLPPRTETDPDKVRERLREKEVVKRRLSTLVESSETVRVAVQEVVTEMNGRRGDLRSFDPLEAFLAKQAYRLCYWRVAADEINYRRFFDINELAAIRVEEADVFEAVHAIIFRLLREGHLTGLRIDHPDGLFDPEQYFLDLHGASRRALSESAAVVPPPTVDRTCYVVAEKILVRDERLRTSWAVHGTTGYEFLNLLNGLFVDPAGDGPFRGIYSRFTGETKNFGDVVYQGKKLVLDVAMSSELHVLARRLDRISEQHRWSRDFTLSSLQEALSEVIACFSCYRSYIRASSNAVDVEDRRYVLSAVRAAKRRNPVISQSIFDFIASVLLLEDPQGLGEAERAERRDFVMRFQQITGPVMAKGLEDTAFYRTYPLTSLNEVGGDPEKFGISVEEFHQRNSERLTYWPHNLLTTSTHDTKRSEDVRARINILSEIPDEWEQAIQQWSLINRGKKIELEGAEVPDANEEYLFYQTLVGAWPLESMDEAEHARFVGRIENYMEKALKEAKLHTSWINPNEAYDREVKNFVRAILIPNPENQFLTEFLRFHARIAHAGSLNSLSQTLLKITSPGVPDFYQGTELWNFTLVDPDNRGPVDFAKRVKLLEGLKRRAEAGGLPLLEELLAHWQDGRIKLYLTYKTLNFRRANQDLFLEGDYLPLSCLGSRKWHVVAFARRKDKLWALVAAPRLVTKLCTTERPFASQEIWGGSDLSLPHDAPLHWSNALTGETLNTSVTAQTKTLSLQEIFQRFPVALLSGSSA
jgi:(1->4)-alpha-D-glucan 1-alpha-D-glucosylmutase